MSPLCPPTRPNIHFSQSLEYFCLALTQTADKIFPSVMNSKGRRILLLTGQLPSSRRNISRLTLPNQNQQYQVNSLPSFHERVGMSHAIYEYEIFSVYPFLFDNETRSPIFFACFWKILITPSYMIISRQTFPTAVTHFDPIFVGKGCNFLMNRQRILIDIIRSKSVLL